MEPLTLSAGTWHGTSRLHDPNTGNPQDSSSTITITPMLKGSFVRLDYTWAYQGAPQEGSLLIGFEKESGLFTAFWIDTWHMGSTAMVCQGAINTDDNTINLLGSYAVPPGPDWGWRIRITLLTSQDANSPLEVSMYNLTPEGEEAVAVESSYTKV